MTDEPRPTSQADFEAMMRRYVGKVAARYAPVLAGLLVVVLIIALVPTTQPASSSLGGVTAVGPGGLSSGSPGAPTSGASGVSGATGALGVSGSSGGLTPLPSGSGLGSGSGVASGSGPSGSGATAPGQIVSSTEPPGVSKTGVRCGPGVRQFTWTIHSPSCVPAFSGNNGGATAPGVTASTITFTYRIPNSAEDAAIAALSGAANVSEPAMVKDMESYISYFNTQFELYGRHVVLKAFDGKGDYIEEDQGQDLGQAQADAVTAHDMGAFGDTTFALGASQYYEQDLAAEHVMSFSGAAQPESWFQQYAPFEYSVQGASGTNGIAESAAVVCRRLAGMNAEFSTNPLYANHKRTFGIIFPETPNYAAEISQYEALVKSECGVVPLKVIGYTINVAEYTQEALSAVAQLQSSGVTTVLCACDPIFPILLTPAASGQGYHPEWFGADFGDPVTQDYTQTDWTEIAGGRASQPSTQTEAYKAFELGFPHTQPAEEPPTSPPYFYVPYYTMLQVFEALQAAGPDLTPTTFEQGMFSLPPSLPGGDQLGGAWTFGNQVFDPVTSFGLVWWNPNAVSIFDGKKGTYEACNDGQNYSLFDLAALGGPGQQLACFGKT